MERNCPWWVDVLSESTWVGVGIRCWYASFGLVAPPLVSFRCPGPGPLSGSRVEWGSPGGTGEKHIVALEMGCLFHFPRRVGFGHNLQKLDVLKVY